jgi:hypothetical protein
MKERAERTQVLFNIRAAPLVPCRRARRGNKQGGSNICYKKPIL